MGVNGEALQLQGPLTPIHLREVDVELKNCFFYFYKLQFIKKQQHFLLQVSENLYQYYTSCENPYQVLQVTCTVSERA